MKKPKPTLFISYSWNDPEVDQNWIHDFVSDLRENGIEATWDMFETQTTTVDLANMMIDSFYNSDFIIPILTKEYTRKANNNIGGVGSEKILTSRMILNEMLRNKIVPIKKSKNRKESIPNHLDSIAYFDFSDDSKYKEEFAKLLHRLHQIDQFEKIETQNAPILHPRKPTRKKRKHKQAKVSFGEKIETHFQKLDFDLANLNGSCFDKDKKNTIVYPVVPRQRVNLIHKAQLEVIKFLINNLDWKAHILITNCGSKDVSNPNIVNGFKKEIIKYCELRKINLEAIKFSFLNDYFSKNIQSGFFNQESVLNSFIDLSSRMSSQKLLKLNLKDYPKEIQEKKKEKPMIDILRPLLTMAITKLICADEINKNNNKPIVLAGVDEIEQWSYLFQINQQYDFGAIYIPVLENDDEDDISHEELYIWSKRKLKFNLETGNYKSWMFSIFIALHYNDIEYGIFKGDIEDVDIYEVFKELKNAKYSDKILKSRFLDLIFKRINLG